MRLKFREKGLDLESFNLSHDVSEFKHNGISKVIIDFKVKQKEKTNIEDKESIYRHPYADTLNELEKQRKNAKQSGDEVGYNYATRNIERIVREHPATVTEEEYNKMSLESKKAFIQVKINEAIVLRNKSLLDYWTQNLSKLEQKEQDSKEQVQAESNNLDEKKKSQEIILETSEDKESVYRHPYADTLNELEKQRKNAKQSGDEVGYNYATRNIERIVREHPATVTEEEYNKMSLESKKAFIQVKINEAIVLRNKSLLDYWTQNLSKLEQKEQDSKEQVQTESNNLDEKKESQETVVETSEDKEPVQSDPVSQVTPNEERTKKEKHNYKYYFDEMMKVIQRYNPDNATAEEKKQAIGEIYYYMGYMTYSLTNMQEISDLILLVINELSDTPFKIKLRDSILEDIIWEKNKIVTDTHEEEETIEMDSEFSRSIQELRSKLKKIQQSYKYLLQGRSIDEDELDVLIQQMNSIVKDSYSLYRLITTKEAKKDLIIVINELEEQKEKMMKLQRGVEDLKSGLRY